MPRSGLPGRGLPGWRFWIDRGGTFTDLVALSPSGITTVRKLLSHPLQSSAGPGSASGGLDPAVAAIRGLLNLTAEQPIPAGLIAEVRVGTTVATNALLERRGAPTLLLVSRGFGDALRIGDQHRPDLFALDIRRPAPLHARVLEVTGRLAADGHELEPLVLDDPLATALAQARADGLRSCAVALLHAARHPRHERQLGAWLERFCFEQVALSHAVAPRPRLIARAQTAVVEAYVGPALQAYLAGLRRALGAGTSLRVMQSSGGLLAPELIRAKDTILSGPAGGMVGALKAAAGAACTGATAAGALCAGAIVGFDMGGTSTDVFHVAAQEPASTGPQLEAAGERWERSDSTVVAGLPLEAAMLPIHTVAAGGGSVLHFDGERLQVGPASAGAQPGPACYGRGGPLTITDANLLLGRLQPAGFPAVFGATGDQPLDPEPASAGFAALAARIAAAVGRPHQPEALAEGAVAIAIDHMAAAIRRISIQQGHDIRSATLVCFGGAGGQHACALAETLEIDTILLHPLAGVLSAYGLGQADQRLLREQVVREPLTASLLPRLAAWAEALTAAGAQVLGAADGTAAAVDGAAAGAWAVAGGPASTLRREVRVALRYSASEVSLQVPLGELAAMEAAFDASHRRHFGHAEAARTDAAPALVVERLEVELVWPAAATRAVPLRVAAAATATAPAPAAASGAAPASPFPTVPLYAEGRWQAVPLLRREQLAAGQTLQGPALLLEAIGTLVLAVGWRAEVLPQGELLLRRTASDKPTAASSAAPAATSNATDAVPAASSAAPTAVDPVRLELFHHRFAAIAEQMGERLRQSARSVNIRERLDFSCALFDAAGALVANAPHIPVHLGSMGESVASLLDMVGRGERPPLRPGDVIATNDPYNGGTHLPDITVISPVFAGADRPCFFVACRGHHADVGGLTPGSMPPHSRSIAEEGLLLTNVPLLREGVFEAAAWQQRLQAGPWPVRNPHQFLADLQAQMAANQLGAAELERLCRREGLAEVTAYMAHVQDNAAAAVRRVIGSLNGGHWSVELDGGARIAVAVKIDRSAGTARIDFSGTSPQQPGNLNAPLAITKAVVLYVFRCLVAEQIPLNAGCFRPLELVVPEGCLLRPRPPAAVVAGNVETSQAVANALFGALGVMAAAQGTMNNLIFGDADCQYYETICGGSGAGQGFAGADAVQSHMTNSRLTDPEVLEQRFPVRLESFRVRQGSGGAGRWRGGEGVERRLRFLQPMTVSLLTGSRRVPPFGLAGGKPGAPGRNRLERGGQPALLLEGAAELQVQEGDLLEICTPGGGGYGES
ncbi:hydantoinase B/oxoprolinase family protein [Synechococcus sp. ATX 2A4]|nr:hydantoinase B/oxoprolinase family protein [Synechococcus sp. ATX 2A4]